MKEEDVGRKRVKKIQVSLDFWLMLMTQENILCIKCIEGLPKGSVLVGSNYDLDHSIVELLFYHPSFDSVEDGEKIPVLTPVFQSIETEG